MSLFSIAVLVLLLVRHRGNLARIWAGTERRSLFGRRHPRPRPGPILRQGRLCARCRADRGRLRRGRGTGVYRQSARTVEVNAGPWTLGRPTEPRRANSASIVSLLPAAATGSRPPARATIACSSTGGSPWQAGLGPRSRAGGAARSDWSLWRSIRRARDARAATRGTSSPAGGKRSILTAIARVYAIRPAFIQTTWPSRTTASNFRPQLRTCRRRCEKAAARTGYHRRRHQGPDRSIAGTDHISSNRRSVPAVAVVEAVRRRVVDQDQPDIGHRLVRTRGSAPDRADQAHGF